MNKATILLMADAAVNYALGILCILYPFVAETIGAPLVENSFYPNILGGVLFGIGVALTIECCRNRIGLGGLGLAGAVAINLSGGIVLVFWLILGNLAIPFKGRAFLWMLAVVLVLISSIELMVDVKKGLNSEGAVADSSCFKAVGRNPTRPSRN